MALIFRDLVLNNDKPTQERVIDCTAPLDPPNEPREEQTEPSSCQSPHLGKNFDRWISRSNKQPSIQCLPVSLREIDRRKFSFSEKTQTLECTATVPMISLKYSKQTHKSQKGIDEGPPNLESEGAGASVGRAGPVKISTKLKMVIAESV
jgi:hypothetical protein